MRAKTLPVLLLAALAACSTEGPEEPPPWADFDPFATPSSYTVQPGDTLTKIAYARGVTVEDLQTWNGIEGDLIEVDQVLLVWTSTAPARTVRTPSGPGRKKSGAKAAPTISVATVMVDTGPVRTATTKVTGPKLVRTAGVLGALDDGTELSAGIDPALADSISSLSVHRSGGSGTAFDAGRRSALADAGTAEGGKDIGRIVTSFSDGPGITSATVRAKRLAAPARKRCLAGPSASDLSGDYGMASGKGLSEGQIRATLDSFVRHTSACIPAGSSGGLSVTTEITVGCDGRVSHVEISSSGGAPPAVTACIAETLSYAGFAAHDLPDGYTFGYPIHFKF